MLLRKSLARRMAIGFLLSHVAVLSALMLLVRPLLLIDDDDLFGADVATYFAVDSVVRGADGRPSFRPTPSLVAFRRHAPASWVVVDVGGREFVYGGVPPRSRAAIDTLPRRVRTAEMILPGLERPHNAVSVQTLDTVAGPARVAAGGVRPASVGWSAWLAYLVLTDMIWIIPVFGVLGLLAVAVVVPLVLRTLRPIAAQAAAVGPEQLDRRLVERGVVAELRPVVGGFNRALDRLAEALGRQRQFLADTAHELRTPVAVLGAQVDLLPDLPARRELQRGIARLGGMIGQMLDAQRLILSERQRVPTDLVALSRGVVADIAPLAIAGGYGIALETGVPAAIVAIDPQAVGRAIANLLGNAVAHGGGTGMIVLRIRSDGVIEIEDEGPGIAPDARGRVFEPFRRERWDRDGCGLGLYLVRQIVQAHGGDVDVGDGAAGGALFRITFPAVTLAWSGADGAEPGT